MRKLKQQLLFVLLLISPCMENVNATESSWTQPEIISEQGSLAFNPQIQARINGNALSIFWTRKGIIQASSFDGQWKKPINISIVGQPAISPSLAVNLKGDAFAVWTCEDQNGQNAVIQAAAYSGSSDTWSEPVNISPVDQYVSFPQIAINSSGKAIAVWNCNDRIQAAHFNGTEWEKAIDLGIGNIDSGVQVAIGPNGDAVVVWCASNTNFFRRIFKKSIPQIYATSYKASTNTWKKDIVISGNDIPASSPQIALSAKGDGIAIWLTKNSSNAVVQSKSFSRGNWSDEITDVSVTTENADSPQVSLNFDGQGFVVWNSKNGSLRTVQASAYSTKTNLWESPLIISDEVNGNALNPQISVCNQTATVGWIEDVPGLAYASVAQFIDGSWTKPTTLSNNIGTASRGIQVATSPKQSFAVWSQAGALASDIQASVSAQ